MQDYNDWTKEDRIMRRLQLKDLRKEKIISQNLREKIELQREELKNLKSKLRDMEINLEDTNEKIEEYKIQIMQLRHIVTRERAQVLAYKLLHKDYDHQQEEHQEQMNKVEEKLDFMPSKGVGVTKMVYNHYGNNCLI